MVIPVFLEEGVGRTQELIYFSDNLTLDKCDKFANLRQLFNDLQSSKQKILKNVSPEEHHNFDETIVPHNGGASNYVKKVSKPLEKSSK